MLPDRPAIRLKYFLPTEGAILLPSRATALLWIFIACFVAAVRPGHTTVFNPETFTLDNGLQVIVVPNHRAPVVVHMIWYKVGAADEPVGMSGVAHFLEHLMFKGTPRFPKGQFSEIVARNGGTENAFTGSDYTGYYQKVAKDRLALVMELEADRMVNLVLDEAEVVSERDVVLEERRTRVDNEPSAQLAEELNAVQFLVHPYGTPVIGWESEIRALDREDALAWYHRYYAPNNAVLIISGDATASEVKPLAEKFYGTIPARPLPPRVRPQEPPRRTESRVKMHDERVRQPTWRRSFRAPSLTAGTTEHAYPLEILSEILGGGPTSRLYRSLVVDQRIAVAAGAYYDQVSLDPTTFTVYAAPAPGVEVARIEAAVDAELATLLAEGVTEEEVTRVRKRLLADAVYARDDLFVAARVFGSALAAGLAAEDVENWPDSVSAVTGEQIHAAARAVLDARSSVVGVLLPAVKD